MIWECNSCRACECAGSHTENTRETVKGRFAAVFQDRASEQDMFDLWLEIMRIYTSLCLTLPHDRPHALAGIATQFSRKLESHYLAGIWTGDLARALLWCDTFPSRHGKIESSSRAPTRSCLSQYSLSNHQSATRYWIHKQEFVKDNRLRIHHSSTFCNYLDDNVFGEILSGQLK